MKKTILLIFIFTFLLAKTIFATVNLDFRLDIEDKLYYPNEKIPVNVSIINRDTTFTAKDSQLSVHIADRFFIFDLGDIKLGDKIEKKITLPEFPPGTHTIEGIINYTGILEERFTAVTYNSFEVLFPPIERYPRNVFVSGYDLPEKIIGGKSYDVSITITNDGEVDADLLIEFGFIDEFFEEKTKLNSGESKTVKMTVKFDNPGVSLMEARAYALINGEKYLLNYRGKKTYVQAERKAKLIFDKIELVNEADNAINQEDTVKFKIFIKNDGETATDVKGELLSNIEKINILDSSVSYVTIISKDSIAPSDDIFEIEAKGIEAKDYELNLKLNYIDSENREKEIKIPITINEGGDFCKKDKDCSNTQTCENNQCLEIPCECGYVENHKCINYECCSDEQCDEDIICNQNIHKCEIPSDLTNDVLIVTIGNEINKNDNYLSILNNYKEILKGEGLSSFYIELDSPKVEKFFNIKLKDQENWKIIKLVINKILHKTSSKYLIILGGVDVIPMPVIENGCFFDYPNGVPTDDLYGDLNLDKKPDIIVARIPTGREDKSTDTIIKVLQKSISLHKSKIEIKKPFFIGDTCVGYRDSPYAEAKMSIDNYLLSSSCLGDVKNCVDTKEFINGINSDMVYFVVHGDGRSFMAEVCRENSHSSAGILKAKTASNYVLPNIFMTVACFGAAINTDGYHLPLYKDKSTTISFLNNGVTYYGGNTLYGLTIGGAPRVEGSVGVDMGIYKKILEGKTIGESVLETKNNLLQKSKTECEFAVVYEKQLYGDPTLKIR